MIAILEAMQLSVDSGITKEVNGIIESDSANAISWLCMKPDKRQETTKCGGLMSLKSMTIKPVLKEANIVASILAKQGLIRDIKILAWL